MKTCSLHRYTGFRILFSMLIMFLGISIGISGASTQSNLYQYGSGFAVANGDYIGSSGGLDTYYRYYIEVPPGLSTLYIDLWDGDVGAGSNANDLQSGGSWDTRCRYIVRDPNNTRVARVTLDSSSTAYNNAWVNIYTVSNPIAGHWEVRVRMDSGVTTGDDVNGYGLRAHDGTSGSGGIELPIYALSSIPPGMLGTTALTSTFYPWVTYGCTVDYNDFDGDNGTNACRITYSSRTGAVSGTYDGSGATAWLNTPISFESDDSYSKESGIWSAALRYDSSGSGNLGTFYVGNQDASNPAPTANPEDDTFRIYFPADGGGTPVKPYMVQRLTFVSGSNPAQVGSNTVVSVTVDFVNPTAHSTANASSTVSAYVPGGQVTYLGSTFATVSQGSIASQPATGGSGTITWNPGTITAGSTASLTYRIQITPTSTSPIDVTGTPASNGTRAVYVDETGNTSQNRATYTYGPLCGLSVTAGTGNDIPTWAGISRFGASHSDSRPTIEWHTSGEIGVVGFNLHRLNKETGQYFRVNPILLPAQTASPRGGVYRFADPNGLFHEPITYRLEEIDARGRSNVYGPFTIDFNQTSWEAWKNRKTRTGPETVTGIDGFRSFARIPSDFETRRLEAARDTLRLTAPQGLSAGDRLRMIVQGRGLVYVSAAQVAAGLGIPETKAAYKISTYRLRLTGSGKEIAWLADENGSGLYFYNAGEETVFFNRNVFFLEKGPGLAMDSLSAAGMVDAADNLSFRDTLHFEENHYQLLLSTLDPAGDLWFWEYVSAGNGEKIFPIRVNGIAGAGTAALKITLQGATDTSAATDHHAVVRLNGREIGDTSWSGASPHVMRVNFDASWLQEGDNIITVSGTLDTGAPYSIFYVDSMDLEYPRLYQAFNNSLICRADGNPTISVSGISDQRVIVLDISNPEQPVLLYGATPDVLGRISFIPPSDPGTYLVSGSAAPMAPLTLVPAYAGNLREEARLADYIVISPREFRDTAERLADFRRDRGLITIVATLAEIYDEFNHGIPSPFAIRDFLADAYINGRVRYAVLAGKGTYDYLDCQGYGDNRVPVIMAPTPHGLCAADGAFGDITGNDGLPEIAVGRLPAVTETELRIMIDKIKTYERSQGAWTDKAIFIADNADDGGDFASACDDLDALAVNLRSNRFYLNDTAGNIHEKIIAKWNAGRALVTYCGHAGIDGLAGGSLLDIDDAAAFNNGERLPLAVMLTCVAGRFELPGSTSLAEALMLNPDGGMAGGLAPSGLAMHDDSLLLGKLFFKKIFHTLEKDAGTALVKAMKRYRVKGGAAYLLRVYNWLGDPAAGFK